MRTTRVFCAVILAAFLAAGATCQGGAKTPDKLTAAERGVLATSLYNNAFSNYNLQFEATPKPMSESMRDYFQGYKKAMEAIYPVIAAYNSIAQIGAVPTPEQEAQIIRAIYQLQAMLMSDRKE